MAAVQQFTWGVPVSLGSANHGQGWASVTGRATVTGCLLLKLGLSDEQEPGSQAGAEAHTDRPDLLTAEPSVSALSSAVGEHSRLRTCLGLGSQRCFTRISVGIWPGQCELLGQVQFLRLLIC